MYKWHVHSAIGRGRPFASDIARVTDGIASSLRQFSISLSRCAEDNNDGPRITYSGTRSQRSADAFNEVSSLAPRSPPRGVDARSLGAQKPSAPFQLRIHRDGDQSQTGDRTNIIQRPARGSGFAPRAGGAGGSGFGPRGTGRGVNRGRGGARGRGARKARGGKKDKREGGEVDEAWARPQLTEEELAYHDMSEGGLPTDYQPETSFASLSRYGPAVMSSRRGIYESVVNRIMVATDNKDPSFDHASMHLARMDEGLGTSFEDAEQRSIAEKFYGGKLKGLTEEQKKSIMQEWVAGRYTKLKAPEEGNVLAQARQLSRRNGTYLPEDRIKFDKTLKALLPADMKEALYQEQIVQRPAPASSI